MKRFPLLVLLALSCGTSLAHAQMGQPYYGNGGYPPAMPPMRPMPPMPYGAYGYPPAYRQPAPPIQPVQYPYGYAPRAVYAPAPVYAPQRPVQYGYDNGYGVNFQYVENPIGVSPTPAPYSAVANQRALERLGATPAPGGMVEVDQGFDSLDGKYIPSSPPPVLPFHRNPCDVVWFSADYVAAYLRPMRLAGPLVTTGSALDGAPGALGRPSTLVLFGNETVNFNLLSGFRTEMGMFLDRASRFSIELGGFYLIPSQQSYNTASDSNGSPLVSRPIFNVAAGRPGAFVNSVPGTVAGNLDADFRTEMFGVELNARYHQYVRERLHVDSLVGFRYLRLAERMEIRESLHNIQPGFLTYLGGSIGDGDTLLDDDQFRTSNQFFGPQVGIRASWENKWFTAGGFAKLGVGATQQNASIAGSTTLVTANGSQIAQGGILALPSNIGTHSRTIFGVLPEFGLNVGVDLTQCVRVKLGYSLLLWNKVLRPGSQYDLNINPGQVPGNPDFNVVNGAFAPSYRFNDEFFFTHSFNLGIEMHY